MIWVNGKPKHFYDAEPNAHYTNFVRVKGDVYFSGYIDSLLQPEPNAIRKPIAYWKNGERFILPEGGYCVVADMKMAGNDVYMVGLGDSRSWKIWKNGEQLMIPAQNDWHSTFISLTVDEHNEVSVIYDYYNINQIWKDGGTTELVISNPHVKFFSVTAYRGAFYLAGARIDKHPEITLITPAYWKREENHMDEQILLPFPINTIDVFCDGVRVLGDDIYAVGSDNGAYPTEHVLFWINGQLIYPFDGANSTFRLSRFFVF